MGHVALITPRGDPLPPSDVVRRLAAVSDRLAIRWVASPAYSYFGIFERWRPEDPRWESVRRGEFREHQAYDLLANFPRDVAPDEMAAWVEQRWGARAYGDPAKEAARMVAAHRKAKADADATQSDRAADIAIDQSKEMTPHLRRVSAGVETAHPMVRGGLTA